jgi:DEP domain-containing protein 5
MPIPCDPLAEPFSQFEKSDPLRGPIFISLNIDSIKQNRTDLFEDFRRDTWSERMLLFQEEIVKRFGFIQRECETKTGSNDIGSDWQYTHVTGNMFVLLTSPTNRIRSSLKRLGIGNGSHSSPADSLKSQKRLKFYYQTQQQNSAPQKENYISRHVQNKKMAGTNDSDDEDGADLARKTSVGFLWQWNHMIANKKWKSLGITGTDEIFQLRMLRDFRNFCSNVDGRLVKFWDESWEKKEKLSLVNSN